jgi:hypothetical protein
MARPPARSGNWRGSIDRFACARRHNTLPIDERLGRCVQTAPPRRHVGRGALALSLSLSRVRSVARYRTGYVHGRTRLRGYVHERSLARHTAQSFGEPVPVSRYRI